jgi:uncharacterized membrane protein
MAQLSRFGLFKRISKPDFKRLRNRDNLYSLTMMVLSIILIFIPTGFEERLPANASQVEGLVLEVDNSQVAHFGVVTEGTQTLMVKVLGGAFQDKVIEVSNTLLGKMELDELFDVNDRIFLVINTDDQGEFIAATARGHYRINIEIILFSIFALFLIIFARGTGAKALLSFIFTALMIWKILMPFILKGYDPIFLSLGVVTALNAAIIYLVGGLNKKGTVAFLGALLGIWLTCGLALIFGPILHVHGAVRPFAEALLYTGYSHLDITHIFLAGIFIASSGAVMDLAMDVSSAMNEVILKKPDISFKEAIGSGFAVGRAVVGTMVTTLLLAYSSTYITMLMVFMAQGVPLANIFNMNYVAAEFLNIIVGSFGLVTVAPFTALAGGLIYIKWRQRQTTTQ